MQKSCSLPLEGGGFGGLRRSRKEFKVNEFLTPSVGFAASSPGGGAHALRKLLLTS